MSEIVVGIMQDEYGKDVHENFEKIEETLVSKYSEADIVILPEYSMFNVIESTPEEVLGVAESIEDSWYLSKLSDLASKLSTSILAHFIERSEEERPYSSSIILLPDGKIRKAYSKMHLFDAYGYRESEYFTPGPSPSKPIIMGDMTFYAAICYDIRFPELFRTYALKGGFGVFVQAGWVRGPMKEEILDALARARSHENTYYLVLSNQTGRLFTGRSGLFNPLGYREIDMGFKPGYMEVSLNKESVLEARRVIPVLESASKNWTIGLKH